MSLICPKFTAKYMFRIAIADGERSYVWQNFVNTVDDFSDLLLTVDINKVTGIALHDFRSGRVLLQQIWNERRSPCQDLLPRKASQL